MKIRVHNVTIDRDQMTKPSKQVWDWELPVLESKFPDGLVHVNGVTFVERDALPDADDEFIRLRAQYGVEIETKQAHTDLAFGRGAAGVKALAKAIKGSIWKAPRKSVAKKPAQPEAAAEPVDPLE